MDNKLEYILTHYNTLDLFPEDFVYLKKTKNLIKQEHGLIVPLLM